MSINAAAVGVLKRHQAEDLLPMLGLLDEDGRIKPDDTTTYRFEEAGRSPGARNPNSATAFPRPGRDRSAVPPGLANLPPPAPVEPKPRKAKAKVIKPRKPREVPECGTYKAYSRHRRRNEDIDDACRQAARDHGRLYNTEYKLRKRKEKEMNRLLKEGVSPAAAATLVELVR